MIDRKTHINILSGSLNGFTQVLISFPLDTVKINYQTNHIQYFNYKSLYRGIKCPLYTVIPLITLQFTLEEQFKTIYSNNFITGALSGFITSPLTSITDLYRIRQQKNITNNINIIRGMKITSIRETLALSIYFGSYNLIKKKCFHYNFDRNITYMLSGSLCGMLSWTLTYPLDVIKSRIQSYKVETIKEGFMKGNLWNGIYICNLRSVLINSVGFLIFENSKTFLDKNLILN